MPAGLCGPIDQGRNGHVLLLHPPLHGTGQRLQARAGVADQHQSAADAYWGNFADMRTPAANMIKTYLCPSDPNNANPITWTNGWVMGNYAYNHDAFNNPNDPTLRPRRQQQVFPAASRTAPRTRSASPRSSRTTAWRIRAGTALLWAHGVWNPWWEPPQLVCRPRHGFQIPGPADELAVQLRHPDNLAYFRHQRGLMDGSVRFVSAGISPVTWAIALTPNGWRLLPATGKPIEQSDFDSLPACVEVDSAQAG